MKFDWKYFVAFISIFLVEVLIAVVFKDSFIRPFFGDLLVVILLYCFVRTFFKLNMKNAVIGVLVFAFMVEFAQYFKLVEVLGLEGNRLARIVIGSTFDPFDLLAYTLGAIAVVLIEKYRKKRI
jgi:Protein of unknown function (DUF2809)